MQQTRAMLLNLKPPIDIDYTTVVNMFLELGSYLVKQDWSNPSITLDKKELFSIIIKYVSSAPLKTDALIDQLQDQIVQNLPKLIEQYQKTTATQQQSNPPEAQQTEKEITKKDKEYVR